MDEKHWYQSRTIWGAVILILSRFAPSLGLEVDPGSLTDLANSAADLAGVSMVLYGRVKAERPIRLSAPKEV
ncbi:MAG: hypothetical protein HQL74_05965 [Magnetococcales bacterium]|nr:hypothetical protein [Magnetococcales bacterium]